MKINNNSKYILYVILFIIFILFRLNHVLLSGEIEEISFKSLAISNYSWPLGIIKQTALNDFFSPVYYLIIGIIKNNIAITIFNSIITLLTIILLAIIGKKLINEKMGLFLALFLSINHFFMFYTSLIAPYCLIFLVQTLVINSLIDYLKRPNKKNFKNLNILNCLLIICDTFGFIYVACELLILYLFGKRKKIYKKLSIKQFNYAFFAFLLIFPLIIVQYIQNTKLVIPNTYNGIGLNLSGLFLMLSDYISPYLSFLAPETQTKTTLGLLYSFSLNPDLNNINSIKILITLFYSTILPLIVIFIFTLRAYIKNYKLRLLWLISVFNLAIVLVLIAMEKIELSPIYTIQFYITNLILLGYGLFTIKDRLIKIILIICLIAIQIVNPDINSFNITIKKNYPIPEPIETFVQDYSITDKDLIIMPNQGYFAKKYFDKKLTIFNYDDKFLQTSKKNGFIKNLSNKKTKTINKKNIHYLMSDYLNQTKINDYVAKYFIDNIIENKGAQNRIILIVDKLNSRPISPSSIIRCANQSDYSPQMRKIDFRYADLSPNQSKTLYDAIKSKTLYNFVNILSANFNLISIVEYKKIDNEYYRINSSNNIYKAINSFDSDYVYIIYNNINK